MTPCVPFWSERRRAPVDCGKQLCIGEYTSMYRTRAVSAHPFYNDAPKRMAEEDDGFVGSIGELISATPVNKLAIAQL